MRVQHRANCLAIATGLLAITPSAIAQIKNTQPAFAAVYCAPFLEIASRAYVRIQAAKGMTGLQQERKVAFWDVHEVAKDCADIQALAHELTKNGLGPEILGPKNSGSSFNFGALDFTFPPGCVVNGTFVCTFLVTKPGTGNAQGKQKSLDWFLLENASNPGDGMAKFEWKSVDAQLPNDPPKWFIEKKLTPKD